MATAKIVSEILFEVLHFGPEDITAVPEDPEGRFADSLIDLRA
jgi:hypothetical protein